MDLKAPPRPLVQRSADSVELFTAGPPTRPYVEVGLLQGRGGEVPSIIGDMRRAAGKAGCDGLVMAAGGATHSVRGTCIIYTDATPGR